MTDVLLTAVGGLAVVLALASRRLRDLPFSEPLAALLLGLALGPGLGLVEVPGGERAHVLELTARLVLGVSLTAVALRYPVTDLRARLPQVTLLLAVVMPGMALVVGLLGAGVLGLPLGLAALLGTCLAPTDPVLSSSVVTGEPAERDLPAGLRQTLSTESGANDGLALPLVLLALAPLTGSTLPSALLHGLGSVAVGVVLGGLLGTAAGLLLNRMDAEGDIEHSAYLVFTLALGLMVLGGVQLAGGNGVLAVFVAGLAYNLRLDRAERQGEQEIEEGVNRLLVLPVFALLGIVAPVRAWVELGWSGIAFVVAVLLLRRLPLVLALRRPLGMTWGGVLFLGWFGPIGVAALFYLALAHAHERGATDPRLWTVGSLVVAASTLVHGVTSSPGRAVYAARSRRGVPHAT